MADVRRVLIPTDTMNEESCLVAAANTAKSASECKPMGTTFAWIRRKCT